MAESLSDATLLEQFVSGREEAAFATLVRRHGPRVERICRRILQNEHDVEDVLQATFLVLSRRAAGIRWHESVSPWLDGVARRLAMHARSGAARQRDRETTVTALTGGWAPDDGRLPERYHPAVEPSTELERRDVRRVIDDELGRLPEKYRAPVVLCDLEGHTREEAARQLGWPTGSMSRRLDRARTLLRHRLTCRGLALATLGVASIAIAAAVLGFGPDRSGRLGDVRQVMSPFKPVSEGGQGHGSVLAAAARREGSHPDFARILPAAHEAVAVARRLEGRDTQTPGALWSRFAGDMKRSALDVERACREADAPALLAAARRLDASCLSCHAVFRPGPTPTGFSIDRLPSRSLLPDPEDQPGAIPTDLGRVSAARLLPPTSVGERPSEAISTPDLADRSLRFAAPMALSTGPRSRPGPAVCSLTIPAGSGDRNVASNEWVAAAVRVGGGPPTGHRDRSVDEARPT
jgi:RNA polymerase sigma factor (sigma-70 family)